MNQENWATNDYETGLSFITDHEDEAIGNIILATDNNVTAILPLGLPLYGAGFYGIFMLAPIVLFMLTLTYFIFVILTAGSLEIQTQILLSLGGLFLLWALTYVLKLLTSSRDLFPRKYFTTLGEKGIAAHYSKLHLPGNSRVAMEWNQISSIRAYSSFFLSGLFAGIFKTHIVEVTGLEGQIMKIPFHAKDEKNISQAVLDLIKQKLNHS